ncbi:pancreatic lipase-related protein 2-like [Mixophyes fleayi]|uniref:pancreatic lipase-related protein 2-like n=1 Tax=Mixophyes fleayi TaxID=3061075 RepID=UPI003F4DBA18
MKLITVLFLFITLGTVKGKEVCYDPLGCFSDDRPWSGTVQRPSEPLPWSPEKINTRFFLFTRDNVNQHQKISARDLTSMETSSFLTSRKTRFIVHGMGDKAENNWVSDMCKEILRAEDVNCIGVDWRRGSGNIQLYAQAASNARLVGAEIAYLLKRWQEELEYSPSNIHIIGHSLGAHIAGEAGKRQRGIKRITGLDPARPRFQNTPDEVSLDPSDADYVDVIHTDTNQFFGAGIAKPIGHFDFYPNGGRHMAGCPNKFAFLANGNAFDTLVCNHFRSFHYYTHSIRHPEGFTSYPCENYEEFISGSCFPCPAGGCPSMGHHSDSSYNISAKRQTFYLNTGADITHLSSWRYNVSVTLSGNTPTYGNIHVSLFGSGANITDQQVLSGYARPGETYSVFIDSGVLLDPIHNVTFWWTPKLFNLFQIQLGAGRIDLQTGGGTISSFCTNTTVTNNVLQTLSPCGELSIM